MFDQVVLDPDQGCGMFVVHSALYCSTASKSTQGSPATPKLGTALSRSAIAKSRQNRRAALRACVLMDAMLGDLNRTSALAAPARRCMRRHDRRLLTAVSVVLWFTTR